MPTKLKVAIVDDDLLSLTLLNHFCNNSEMVEVVASYNDPRNFLNSASTIDFDLCLLDIMMPEMEGTIVAQMLKDKPIIFVTGAAYGKLKEALELSPLDVVTKPIEKVRFDKAINMAYALIAGKDQSKVFNVAAWPGKLELNIADVLMIITDDSDSRHKQVFMRNGDTHVLMDYSIEEIMEDSPMLVQVNKSTVVSLEIIGEVEQNKLRLLNDTIPYDAKEIHIGRTFKKSLLSKLSVH